MVITNLYYTKILNHVESSETAPELYMEHFPESLGSFLVLLSMVLINDLAHMDPNFDIRIMADYLQQLQ